MASAKIQKNKYKPENYFIKQLNIKYVQLYAF